MSVDQLHILTVAENVLHNYQKNGASQISKIHAVNRINWLRQKLCTGDTGIYDTNIYDSPIDNASVARQMIKMTIDIDKLTSYMILSDAIPSIETWEQLTLLIKNYYGSLDVSIAPAFIDVHGNGFKPTVQSTQLKLTGWYRIECPEFTVDNAKEVFLRVYYLLGDPDDQMQLLFADSTEVITCRRRDISSVISLGTTNLVDVSKCRFRVFCETM